MTRAEKAKSCFLSGYNCAQAVAVAFSDLVDMDEKTVARAVSGFGGGMGRLREVCGAFSGAVFILSVLYGYEDEKAFEAKKQLYSDIQNFAEQCRNENGSIICKELLGLEKDKTCSPLRRKGRRNITRNVPVQKLYTPAPNSLTNLLKIKICQRCKKGLAFFRIMCYSILAKAISVCS